MDVDIAHLQGWIGREQTESEVLTPTLVRQFNATFDRRSGTAPGEVAPEIALGDAQFCVVLVVPHRVDELRLGGKQRRTRYTLERDERGHASAGALAPLGANWQVQDVNP